MEHIFFDVDLSNVDLSNVDLSNADFTTPLSKKDLFTSNNDIDLRKSDLRGINLHGEYLEGIDFFQ